MNLEQIKYLAEINRCHSLRQAGEQLHVTAQALSQSLTSLEKELNLTLTESSRTGTFLTSNGHILLDAGEEFLNVIYELQNKNESKIAYKYLPTAKLSVIVVDGMVNTLFSRILTQLYLDFPKIQIDLNHNLTTSEMLEKISTDAEHEFAFISVYHYKNGLLPDISQYPNITFKPLVTSKYCCSVPIDHEIYHYNTISVTTALKYPIVLYKTGEELLLPLLTAYGKPHKVLSIPNFATYNQILQDTSYLAFNRLLTSFEAQTPLKNRKLIPLKENITISFGYICQKNRKFSPQSEEFLEAISKYCENHFGNA